MCRGPQRPFRLRTLRCWFALTGSWGRAKGNNQMLIFTPALVLFSNEITNSFVDKHSKPVGLESHMAACPSLFCLHVCKEGEIELEQWSIFMLRQQSVRNPPFLYFTLFQSKNLSCLFKHSTKILHLSVIYNWDLHPLIWLLDGSTYRIKSP